MSDLRAIFFVYQLYTDYFPYTYLHTYLLIGTIFVWFLNQFCFTVCIDSSHFLKIMGHNTVQWLKKFFDARFWIGHINEKKKLSMDNSTLERH